MASLNGAIRFTGSIDGLSAYKMRGSDKIIFRTHGGASKQRIKTHPNFEPTRNLNNEWRAVMEASAQLRNGLFAMKSMADYNFSGPMNGLVKKIQVADLVNPKGNRSILFSQQPDFFTGFSFNKQTLFDSLIRQPLTAVIDKTTGVADISVPALQPLINFFPNAIHSYYRLVLICAAASDFNYNTDDHRFYPVCLKMPEYRSVESEWISPRSSSTANHYQVTPSFDFKAQTDMIIACAVGLQYGRPGADNTIQPIPFAGAAKILKSV